MGYGQVSEVGNEHPLALDQLQICEPVSGASVTVGGNVGAVPRNSVPSGTVNQSGLL